MNFHNTNDLSASPKKYLYIHCVIQKPIRTIKQSSIIATNPNLSYQTLIKSPQKRGNIRKVVSKNASIIKRPVKKANHIWGELIVANDKDIF
jgi:hypothetical protein